MNIYISLLMFAAAIGTSIATIKRAADGGQEQRKKSRTRDCSTDAARRKDILL